MLNHLGFKVVYKTKQLPEKSLENLKKTTVSFEKIEINFINCIVKYFDQSKRAIKRCYKEHLAYTKYGTCKS